MGGPGYRSYRFLLLVQRCWQPGAPGKHGGFWMWAILDHSKGIPRLGMIRSAFQLVMGVPPNGWMAYFMENTMNMDDDWGYPPFRNPPFWNLESEVHLPIIRYARIFPNDFLNHQNFGGFPKLVSDTKPRWLNGQSEYAT